MKQHWNNWDLLLETKSDICDDIFFIFLKSMSRPSRLKLHKKVLGWTVQNILSVTDCHAWVEWRDWGGNRIVKYWRVFKKTWHSFSLGETYYVYKLDAHQRTSVLAVFSWSRFDRIHKATLSIHTDTCWWSCEAAVGRQKTVDLRVSAYMCGVRTQIVTLNEPQ